MSLAMSRKLAQKLARSTVLSIILVCGLFQLGSVFVFDLQDQYTMTVICSALCCQHSKINMRPQMQSLF